MAKAWNYEGERLLRASPIDYTIIRPGVMGRIIDQSPASLALADNGGNLKVSAITYDAVANLCTDVLDHPNTARSTLCAMSCTEGDGADSWAPLLQQVTADSRSFRDDLLQEHFRAVRIGGIAVVAGFTGLVTVSAVLLIAALKVMRSAIVYLARAMQLRMMM